MRPTLPEVALTPGTPRKKAAVAGPKRSAERAVAAAAPRRRTKKVEKPTDSAILDALQAVIVASLEDDKAENVVALDLTGKTSFCDRMVIGTGIADRQISAMATHLEEKLHENGIKRVQIEGAGGSDWVLIDAGDIIVHLFKPEARTLYALEKMWGADLDDPTPEADSPELA